MKEFTDRYGRVIAVGNFITYAYKSDINIGLVVGHGKRPGGYYDWEQRKYVYCDMPTLKVLTGRVIEEGHGFTSVSTLIVSGRQVIVSPEMLPEDLVKLLESEAPNAKARYNV